MPTNEPNRSGTQVIQRVAALLRAIAARNRTGIHLGELCDEVGIVRPTAHRILQGLVAERLVQQDETTKHYFLGRQLYEMGLAAAPPVNLRDICHPYLQTIANQTGDTVFLTVRSGFNASCLDRVEGSFPVRVFVLEVGRERPLNVGGGALAILSALDDDEIDRILKVNHARTTQSHARYSEAAVRRAIAKAKERGYVLNDVIEVPGVRSVAVPVFDARGKVAAGLSVATVATRLEKARVQEVYSYLAEAAQALKDKVPRQ
jgi:DNA-binding IclR family transcriptional regulator